MSSQDNIKIIRAHYDAVNRGDIDSGARFVDKIFEWVNVPLNIRKRGPEGYRDFLNIWLTALPDAKVEIKNISSNDDWVIVEFIGKGTHNGPFHSPNGDIMPTGKHVEVPFCELFQFKNGKIVKGKLYYDTAGLMKQLGIAPELSFQ